MREAMQEQDNLILRSKLNVSGHSLRHNLSHFNIKWDIGQKSKTKNGQKTLFLSPECLGTMRERAQSMSYQITLRSRLSYCSFSLGLKLSKSYHQFSPKITKIYVMLKELGRISSFLTEAMPVTCNHSIPKESSAGKTIYLNKFHSFIVMGLFGFDMISWMVCGHMVSKEGVVDVCKRLMTESGSGNQGVSFNWWSMEG